MKPVEQPMSGDLPIEAFKRLRDACLEFGRIVHAAMTGWWARLRALFPEPAPALPPAPKPTQRPQLRIRHRQGGARSFVLRGP